MSTNISESDADAFVASWMAAWNSHDPDAIAAHYHDDVVYHSPFVARLAGGADGLRGREALRDYIAAALQKYPDLHFDPPLYVAAGAGSVCFVYYSVENLLAIETLLLDDDHRVTAAYCHYRTPATGS
jgi:hypothetical protein